MTIGVWNGEAAAGLTLSQSSNNVIGAFTGLYGAVRGTAASGSRLTYNKSISFTNDSSKIGIETIVSGTTVSKVNSNIKFIIKYI